MLRKILFILAIIGIYAPVASSVPDIVATLKHEAVQKVAVVPVASEDVQEEKGTNVKNVNTVAPNANMDALQGQLLQPHYITPAKKVTLIAGAAADQPAQILPTVKQPAIAAQAAPAAVTAAPVAATPAASPQAAATTNANAAAPVTNVPSLATTAAMPPPAPVAQEPAQAEPAIAPGAAAVPLVPRTQDAATALGNPNDANNQAFGQMLNKVLPLTPDQIRALRVLFDQSQRAATARPIAVEPRPVISTQIVNFSPGSTPPYVRLAMGSVSSIVFVDSTGAKWPIASYAVPGAGKVYDVKCVDCGEGKDKQGNILLITPLVAHPDPSQGSNITIILQNLDTPISVKLFNDQPVIDYRADLHIPKLGPYAQPTLSNLPDKASPLLMNVLSGIPPAHSRSVKVNGCDCQAWVLNNRLYLRTALPVISPGYMSRISSADGMNAYELPQVPIILASRHGETVTLTIEGY